MKFFLHVCSANRNSGAERSMLHRLIRKGRWKMKNWIKKLVVMFVITSCFGLYGARADVFGMANEGYGGFTYSPVSDTEVWALEEDSARYAFGIVGTDEAHIASLLKSYDLDRSEGQSYTIEGVLNFTEGY